MLIARPTVWLPLLALLPLSLLFSNAAAAECRATSGPQRVPLVELFTSQGCSSCPPADRWLGTLGAESGQRVLPLSLHVGYWDHLGWSDPFARREFNARQRWLAELGGNRTVYTPGVFVDGRELADWRSPRAFERALAAGGSTARAKISLQARPAPADWRVAIDWQPAPDALDPALFVAIKRNGYQTAVGRGENRGERLRNDHVVRAWQGPFAPGARELVIALPDEPAATDRGTLVAIAQDRATGAVLQTLALSLAPCGR